MIGYGYMGGGGMIWWLAAAALLIIPFWRILPRYGIPAWVALSTIIPISGLVLLWVVAFKEEATSNSNGDNQ